MRPTMAAQIHHGGSSTPTRHLPLRRQPSASAAPPPPPLLPPPSPPSTARGPNGDPNSDPNGDPNGDPAGDIEDNPAGDPNSDPHGRGSLVLAHHCDARDASKEHKKSFNSLHRSFCPCLPRMAFYSASLPPPYCGCRDRAGFTRMRIACSHGAYSASASARTVALLRPPLRYGPRSTSTSRSWSELRAIVMLQRTLLRICPRGLTIDLIREGAMQTVLKWYYFIICLARNWCLLQTSSTANGLLLLTDNRHLAPKRPSSAPEGRNISLLPLPVVAPYCCTAICKDVLTLT